MVKGKKRQQSGHSDKPARKVVRNDGSHQKTPKLPLAKTENYSIAQSGDTGEILVTIDERSLTSKFNGLKNGKRAHLETLQCDQCDARPAEIGGTGQCKYYGKGLICYYDIKHIKMYEKLDTRNISDIQNYVDVKVLQNMILADRAIALSNIAGGIPDKVAHRQGAEAREWLKFAAALAIPKVKATQTERFEDEHGFREVIKELYIDNPTSQQAQSQEQEQGLTVGLKTQAELTKDSIEQAAKQKAQEDDIF